MDYEWLEEHNGADPLSQSINFMWMDAKSGGSRICGYHAFSRFVLCDIHERDKFSFLLSESTTLLLCIHLSRAKGIILTSDVFSMNVCNALLGLRSIKKREAKKN